MMTQKRAVLLRAGIFIGFVLTVMVLGFILPLPSVQHLQTAARGAGLGGAAIFIVSYGLITLTPLPKSVLSIAAGVIWGLGIGLLLVYLGAMLGATVAFAIGRTFGRAAVERFSGARIDRIEHLLRRRGLVAVIGARLIPLVPFTVLNYAAGLTTIRLRDYVLGTMIGIIPGTTAYVALGAFGTNFGWQFDLAAWVIGLLTLAAIFAGIRTRRRNRSAVDSAESTVPGHGLPGA